MKILHLGLGRFHRGHQAVYYQRLNELGDTISVFSLSMRSRDARDELRSVNHRYPVIEFGSRESNLRWIDCIKEAGFSQEDLPRILEAAHEVDLITLTITEKGYDLKSSGELDLSAPNIMRDLKTPEAPVSAVGLLSLILKQRTGPLTILSCDNVGENGNKLRSAVEKYAQAMKWNLNFSLFSFPNSMVDRIVPALTEDRLKELEGSYNFSNRELIATEVFSQWVIEDRFMTGRPDWAKVGVEFVSDVRPYEEMKLKLLNASHSYLAYEGLNRGFKFVHEAIADKDLREHLERLYREVIPCLEVPAGFDVTTYTRSLIVRFQNPRLPHQLKQVAMDGSQKLLQRVIPSLLKVNGPELQQVMSSWIDYLWNHGGDLDDPRAKEFRELRTLGKKAAAKKILESFSLAPEMIEPILLKLRPA